MEDGVGVGTARAQLLRHPPFFGVKKHIKPLKMNAFVLSSARSRFCVP
jgi:hypothetical protein